MGAAMLLLLLFPQPLFAYSASHGGFHLWSDRPIDPAIASIVADAERRLRRSDLYEPRARFNVFICNDRWRLVLFTRSAAVGGFADTLFSRNIFLREADIAANRLAPPEGRLADAEVRPLSYFIAHEATHILQSRTFGRLMEFRYPDWLTEGYADWVGKGGRFGIEGNRELLRRGDPRLDHGASGLYRGHHLMVAWLIEREGRSIRDIHAHPPDRQALLRRLAEP